MRSLADYSGSVCCGNVENYCCIGNYKPHERNTGITAFNLTNEPDHLASDLNLSLKRFDAEVYRLQSPITSDS